MKRVTFDAILDKLKEHEMHDRQSVAVGSQTTTSASFVDVTGATITTKNLDGLGSYHFSFVLTVFGSVANTTASFQLLKNGGLIGMVANVVLKTSNSDQLQLFEGEITGIVAGDVLQAQWATDKGTLSATQGSLGVDGILETRIVQ